jgi:23S rRNA pseudouridine1911/1915/1917 synthase
MDPVILYEDNHLIVAEKKAGVLSQRDSSGVPSLLDSVKEYIKKKYHKKGNVFLGLVHRLDKPVSGTIVFARTSKAAGRLHREFAERRVVKIYLALVEYDKPVETGKWIERDDFLTHLRGRSEVGAVPGGKTRRAHMRFMVLAADNIYALLLVHIITGRKHQIRAQLGAIGMPVAGDQRYGSGLSCPDGSIYLHGLYLSFIHPVKRESVSIFTEIPERFSEKITIAGAVRKKILYETDRCSRSGLQE